MMAFQLMWMIGVVAMFVSAVIIEGLVLSTLWGWFAAPLFGLPTLSIPYAIGVSVTAGLITHQYNYAPKEKLWDRVIFIFMHPSLALFVGWLAKLWITT